MARRGAPPYPRSAGNGQLADPGGAAEVLGLHPNTLRSRMRKLGVTKKSVAS
ncbi:MAG: hypothetical protein DMG06_18405 [Acidobacteria bacterium]|nr:MAG: hypothetical protein DMG06_18405 [Acidobacteriota bacterium]